MLRTVLGILVAAALGLGAIAQASAQQRKPPYYASISAGKANMRTGPGRNYPTSWLYRRADLPVKVVEIYNDWRKVEDPDGTRGWMAARLLSRTRTAIVTGGTRPMRESPNESAPVAYRAEAGVVGRISDCRDGWCRFDVKGRRGWIETAHIWGD